MSCLSTTIHPSDWTSPRSAERRMDPPGSQTSNFRATEDTKTAWWFLGHPNLKNMSSSIKGWWMKPKMNGKIQKMATKPPTSWGFGHSRCELEAQLKFLTTGADHQMVPWPWGYPKNARQGWLFFFFSMGKSHQWMMTGDWPYFGKPPKFRESKVESRRKSVSSMPVIPQKTPKIESWQQTCQVLLAF